MTNLQKPLDTAAVIRRFLLDSVVLDPSAQLDGDTPLLQGCVDSVGLMELMTFIEREFGLELDPDDIDEEHFGTVNRIAALVDEARRTQPARP